MEQCGKVKSVKGEYAEVEVRRSTACESCSASHVCPSGRKDAVIRARNDAGAAVGDSVKLETPSINVLLYSFAVFVFPLLVAVAAFFITSGFAADKYAIVAAVCGFAVAFLIVYLTVERSAKKRGGVVVITRVERPASEPDENDDPIPETDPELPEQPE